MGKPLIIKGNTPYNKSKNVIYHRLCNTCNKKYIGWGREYCSKKCRGLSQPRGEKSPFWKGDSIKPKSGRQRAVKMYKSSPCEVCGSTKSERHHIDGRTYNNLRENIMFVCRKHHVAIDRRNERGVLAQNLPSNE